MKLIDHIMHNRAIARANKECKVEFTILTLLVGELETSLKREDKAVTEATDEAVVAVIKKLIKSNNEVIGLYGEVGSAKFIRENKVLSDYLPKQMTEEELTAALQNTLFSSVGEAIKSLSESFPGKFDKAVASKIAKSLL
jgi:uncharacterized protein YqeY